ncbi:MAG: sodium:proline symporter [Pseudomonadota bacterium]
MEFLARPEALIAFVVLVVGASFLIAPRRITVDGFFGGTAQDGTSPRLWTLVLSQVTTWIFARSLLNAAVLGFYYGLPGTLAYTAYYGSFLTGLYIIDRMRADGAGSVQDWLVARFGQTGRRTYNVVIALRLLSEVFANLLVVGIIFGAAYGEVAYASQTAIVALALVGLGYSALGGLRASLRTDVMQMIVFFGVFAVALVVLVTAPEFSLGAILSAGGTAGPMPGWVLLVVALLQVISYPAHDPVMMDRGFLADRKTTRASFLHAFWISALCIFGFGLLGIQAGILAEDGEGMQDVWARMFGPVTLFCINASLLISALSTLDSALSSASRLAIEDMRLGRRTVGNGRVAMALFMLGGVLFMLMETEDLFAAVAVSGTASMFLVPVLVLGLWLGREIPLWSYLVAFAAAILGAAAYFFQSTELVIAIFGEGHKYERLLNICLAVLATGFAASLLGLATRRGVARA